MDFLVQFLSVPVAWQVGHVTFRPPGWLRHQLVRDLGRSTHPNDAWKQRSLEPLDGWAWSSASVTAPIRPGAAGPIEELRAQVQDAIAVARLYQRACVPNWSMDHQTFGLPADIESALEWHWRTDAKGFRGHGGQHHGVLGGWTFRREWLRTFRDRPAFAFLDDALRTPDAPAGSWQQRAITAVRALNTANPRQSQPIRVVLQAVALEALLGDDPPPGHRREFRSQAHPVAQRAALLTCPVDGLQLSGSDTACLDLTAASARAIEKDPRFRGRPADYWNLPCSAYWHVREIFGARNDALHEARDQFAKRTAAGFEGRVDDIILAALDWVVATGATGVGDLDDAIGQLPRA